MLAVFWAGGALPQSVNDTRPMPAPITSFCAWRPNGQTREMLERCSCAIDPDRGILS